MRIRKPAPGGNRATGDEYNLNGSVYSPKLSETQAQTYARRLGGNHFGNNINCPGPGHGPRDRSLSVKLDSHAPDGFRVHSFAGDDWKACRDHVKAALGLQTYQAYTPPARISVTRNVGRRDTDNFLTDYAEKIWRESHPLKGTIAESYLRGRGITCLLTASLRFAPACWHATGQHIPAMVALVQGSSATAVHRTYLRADGLGKAEVAPNKAMLGSTQGGAVRLTNHRPGPLVVAEGIETALSLASGLVSEPATVWAALSASGLRGLRLPDPPGRLIIASDGDTPGRDAAHALALRAHGLDWAVSLLPAPDGCDWNDILTVKGQAI